MKATVFPSGETRTSLTQPLVLYRTLPGGYSILTPSVVARAIARDSPSGDQSAHSTLSATSRGDPPVNGTRASVPHEALATKKSWSRVMAISSVREIPRMLLFLKPNSRDCVAPGRVV